MKLDKTRRYVEVTASDHDGIDGVADTLNRLAKYDAELVDTIHAGRDHSGRSSFLIVATIAPGVDLSKPYDDTVNVEALKSA